MRVHGLWLIPLACAALAAPAAAGGGGVRPADGARAQPEQAGGGGVRPADGARAQPEQSDDLPAIRARGVLRHLGVPYASFVTGGGDGFDVELVRRFADWLGVRYEFVETSWAQALSDLTGRRISPASPRLEDAAPAPVRGDVLACGVTILPWRERVAAFSTPVFPTQVWLVARAGSSLAPIVPSGSLHADIEAVRALLRGRMVIGVPGTCLDPSLYALGRTRIRYLHRDARLDEVAPMLIQGDAELALLDVADAMLALQKFPGALKVIGPVSERQRMGVAFRRGAPQLRAAFEAFLAEIRRDGTYDRLVAAYFPEAPVVFPDFFGKG
jgi:ABC-type amino acid transport substrate-binding protein